MKSTWELDDRGLIAPADHEHAGKEAVVIGEAPCAVCEASEVDGVCQYVDLLLRLDDGTETRIYEPEFMPLDYLDHMERVK